jgi:hypothetical protein
MYDPQKQLDRAVGKAKDKAVSTVVWWAIGCVVALLLVCFVGGLFLYIGGAGFSSYMQTAGAAQRTASAWDGLSTLECTGANTMELDGVTAALPNVGVRASGGCNLTLRNCNLTAPVAIEASGGAHVTVIGGTVTGTITSIQAGGGSTVDVQGAVVTGPVARSGGAHVNGVP